MDKEFSVRFFKLVSFFLEDKVYLISCLINYREGLGGEGKSIVRSW